MLQVGATNFELVQYLINQPAQKPAMRIGAAAGADRAPRRRQAQMGTARAEDRGPSRWAGQHLGADHQTSKQGGRLQLIPRDTEDGGSTRVSAAMAPRAGGVAAALPGPPPRSEHST